MVKGLKIGVFSLCLVSALAFRANAQQTASRESDALHLEIKNLLQQDGQLRAKIKTSQDQIKSLYNQMNQLVLQIKPLREQVSQTDGQLYTLHKKIEIDKERLSHLTKNQ